MVALIAIERIAELQTAFFGRIITQDSAEGEDAQMLRHIRRSDLWIIANAAEPVSWTIERSWLGWNSFTQARMVLAVTLASLLSFWYSLPTASPDWSAVSSSIGLVSVCLLYSFLAEYSRKNSRGANPEVRHWGTRTLVWVVNIVIVLGRLMFDTAEWWYRNTVFSLGMFSVLVFLYLIACRKPPPIERRSPIPFDMKAIRVRPK